MVIHEAQKLVITFHFAEDSGFHLPTVPPQLSWNLHAYTLSSGPWSAVEVCRLTVGAVVENFAECMLTAADYPQHKTLGKNLSSLVWTGSVWRPSWILHSQANIAWKPGIFLIENFSVWQKTLKSLMSEFSSMKEKIKYSEMAKTLVCEHCDIFTECRQVIFCSTAQKYKL